MNTTSQQLIKLIAVAIGTALASRYGVDAESTTEALVGIAGGVITAGIGIQTFVKGWKSRNAAGRLADDPILAAKLARIAESTAAKPADSHSQHALCLALCLLLPAALCGCAYQSPVSLDNTPALMSRPDYTADAWAKEALSIIARLEWAVGDAALFGAEDSTAAAASTAATTKR